MKILIANPGSTSYKCKLIDMDNEGILFSAIVERIGDETGIITYQHQGQDKVRKEQPVKTYEEAVGLVLKAMESILPVSDVAAIGFKTVLARGVTGCVELKTEVLDAMKEYMPLAPVHTSVYLTAITVFKKLLPDKKLYGLFETAFHTCIPDEASVYGIPYELAEKYGIRKYGFHGASHRYVSEVAAQKYVVSTNPKVISCHLGGSASVCAVRDCVSVDTSMGMSPQCGLLNAERVGDLDTYALLYLMEREGLNIDETRGLLASKGGLYGISGVSGDLRDIEKAMDEGNKRAETAFNAFAYGVKRYIGEYLAVLNGADAIVFTGGLGQHSPGMRARICKDMENLGIVLDEEMNMKNPAEGVISAEVSRVKILIIPTNEELIVAREIKSLITDH